MIDYGHLESLEVKAGFSFLMGKSRGWCKSACVIND